MTLIDDLERAAEEATAGAEDAVKRVAKALQEHLLEHPQHVFALLRALKPVLVVGGFAIVTRYDDVVEVLERDEAFSVSPYAAKMRAAGGNFILGEDDSATYERSVSILRLAAPRADVPTLAPLVAQEAERLVEAAPGRLDVVHLTSSVPAWFMGQWFGTPGPDSQTMIDWTLSVFAEIFLNLQGDEEVARRAAVAAAALNAYLEDAIAARKSSGEQRPDVLGRLLAMQGAPETRLSDHEVRANLFGLIVGFIPTVMTSVTFAMDALLDRPDALGGARDAALADDDAALRAHLWEAMRLEPQAPGLIRRASVDYVVAEGTRHATKIPAGTLTFAMTQSAMLDGDVVQHPTEFRTDRPPHDYLNFGTGMHECFGRYANAAQIPLTVKPLLRRRGLRRAHGSEGKMARNAQYPTRLVVEFDD